MNRIGRIRRLVSGALVIGGLAYFAGSAHPSGPPASPQKIGTMKGITQYWLDNNLRGWLFPNDPASTVAVIPIVLVGSGQEGHGETHMALLLNQKVFNPSSLKGDRLFRLPNCHNPRFEEANP